MKTLSIVFGSALALGLGLFPYSAMAQDKPGRCQIKIDNPLPGAHVSKEGKVTGTAKIPEGTFLWVLAHMKDFTGEWWPQGGHAAIFDENGKWVIIAGYGQPKDINEDFEVAVVVVNPEINANLGNWFKDAKQKNVYDPIPLPASIDGCPPIKITVKKIS